MIKNIILDFGNVIYNVDPKSALHEFSKLSSKPELFAEMNAKDFDLSIDSYERGLISIDEFFHFASEKYKLNCTLDQFKFAWNSILIGRFDYSYDSIKKLASKFNLFLLSNTSELHYNIFEPECREIFAIFDKLYFSHIIGLRKPKPLIYQYLINDSGILPEQTVFADDLIDNLEPFKEIGGNIELISKNFTLKELAEKYAF